MAITVQKGEFTTGSNTIVDVTIDEVDISKTILFHHIDTQSLINASNQPLGYFLNSTTIRFERIGTSNVTVYWQIVENDNFSVQHIKEDYVGNTWTEKIPQVISTTDLSKSFCIIHNTADGGTTEAAFVGAELTSETSVDILTSSPSTVNGTFLLQVIEYSGAKCQMKTGMSTNASDVSVEFEPVDLQRSLFIYSTPPGAASNRAGLLDVINESSAVITRLAQATMIYCFYIVTHPDDFLIEKYNDNDLLMGHLRRGTHRSKMFFYNKNTTFTTDVSHNIASNQYRTILHLINLTGDGEITMNNYLVNGQLSRYFGSLIKWDCDKKIEGTITHNQTPVEGAKVFVIDTEVNALYGFVYSDPNGNYSIPGLIADREYHVFAEFKDSENKFHTKSFPFVKFESD
jgi:hypothetical protein